MVAEDIADFCKENDVITNIIEMENLTINDFLDLKDPVLITSSTYGQGDVPDNGQKFYNNLKEAKPNLSHIKFTVFGLGDMTYRDTFAYGGKKFFQLLIELKAEKIGNPYYHDASDGSLPEEEAVNWFKENIINIL